MVEEIRPRRITTGEGRRSSGMTTAAVLLLLVTLPLSHAFPHYADQIPNGRAVPNNSNGGDIALGVGHAGGGGGGPRNPFGDDFQAQNHIWTTELCQMDSDGDGRTNGEELGDPDCTWVAGTAPSGPARSHPGVADVDDSVDNDHSHNTNHNNNDEKPSPVVAEPSEPAPSPPGLVDGENGNQEPPVEAPVVAGTTASSTPDTNQSAAEQQQPPVTAAESAKAAGGACGTNDDCLGGLVCGENGVCVSNHHHDDSDKDNTIDSGSSNLLVNGHPDTADERISKRGGGERLRGPFGRPAMTLFVGVTMLLSLMLVMWAAAGGPAISFLQRRRQQQQPQQSYRPVVVHDDDDE